MTAFGRLFRGRNSIIDLYFKEIDEAEENCEKEFNAAVKIQKIWRDYFQRRNLRRLHEKATLIQSCWRRHMAKFYVMQLREEKYSNERMDFFNEMASKIQKRWRGYYTRTQIFDFYKHQNFIVEQAIKNQQMAQMLDSYYAETSEIQNQKDFNKDIETQRKFALNNHHLVSTFTIPSVFKPKPFVKDEPQVPSLEQYIRSINRQKIVVPSLTPR
ncbi:IQ calmodulin-binding motif family protein [Trichomonas vaginalis G3]|uniref:IQ calmodulin-binding motif family protein n=1 Tax=Trichomonas vaginalis (strain ATCC PRA-98 / G3) TaxID=412133 RepID=A2GCE7_TRIV3|nr:spermatogenesis-associated protein 17 family [Trichomonas vaginalis G3]EAX85168.1 IQ calmodulin-binding motif family protein [Trichomonas vaginalis G3]KAI5513969.1 spermatogenesis-associated protein 17 family [Trichomonas vaginalis G3]|eukprot:XP_001298098.1 IQ calmodulin-binding motif family protein [Trichomonas vaginalis G3]